MIVNAYGTINRNTYINWFDYLGGHFSPQCFIFNLKITNLLFKLLFCLYLVFLFIVLHHSCVVSQLGNTSICRPSYNGLFIRNINSTYILLFCLFGGQHCSISAPNFHSLIPKHKYSLIFNFQQTIYFAFAILSNGPKLFDSLLCNLKTNDLTRHRTH